MGRLKDPRAGLVALGITHVLPPGARNLSSPMNRQPRGLNKTCQCH